MYKNINISEMKEEVKIRVCNIHSNNKILKILVISCAFALPNQ